MKSAGSASAAGDAMPVSQGLIRWVSGDVEDGDGDGVAVRVSLYVLLRLRRRTWDMAALDDAGAGTREPPAGNQVWPGRAR